MERAAIKTKKQRVLNLEEKLKKAKAFYIVDFNGLGANDMNSLRKKFKSDNFEYFVIKNTILKLASEKLGFNEVLENLTGPNAISISYDDAIGPAKVINEYYKQHKLPKVKLCYVEGQWLAADGVRKVANLPSKAVLIGQVLNLFNSPITRFVNVLKNTLTNFVVVLDEIRGAKESKQEPQKEKIKEEVNTPEGENSSDTKENKLEKETEESTEEPKEEASKKREGKEDGENATDETKK